jgi:hypothetical protein
MVIQMFKLLSVITIFILTTFVANPSYSDDVTINLDSTTPYVDIPVTVTEPVDATISTTTGTPNDVGFIDSWIELWQDTVRIAYNDDGNHSGTNVLASLITIPLTVGEYFIRATSYAYICCNSYPTGSYLLSTNLVVVSPTPTPSSSPTIDEPTPEPSSPSQSPSDIPSPSESPTVPVVPVQEPSEPDPVVLLESSTPVPSPLPSVQDTLEVVVDSSPSSFPSSLENDLPFLEEEVSQDIFAIDETQSLLSFLPKVSIEALQETFQQISETITAALDTVSNLGSEFTPEERKQAQQVVLGAIIVTQLSISARRIK